MSEKFKGKYRIESARLQNWDYASSGLYFITICTADRQHFFGEVEGGVMQLSEIGEIAKEHWCEIPGNFPFADLNEFVVMPNHIHGIIVINNAKDVIDGRDAINRVSTNDNTQMHGGVTGPNNPMLSDNLSRIIRWYKGRVTFETRKIHADFMWQSRFHDHIIRNNESYCRIRDYIRNNPSTWDEDKFRHE